RRNLRAFGRSLVVGFLAELVETRLNSRKARRQTVERTGYRVRNWIDLLTQGLEIRVGQILTLEACFNLLKGSAEFVEGGTDWRLLWWRLLQNSWWTRWPRRLAIGRPLLLRGPLRLVLFLDRRLFRGSLSTRGRCRDERKNTD